MTQPSQFDPALIEACAVALHEEMFSKLREWPGAKEPPLCQVDYALAIAVLSAREKWEREKATGRSSEER